VTPFNTTPGVKPETDIDVAVPTTGAPTAKLAVYVPADYGLDFGAAPGTKIGDAVLGAQGPVPAHDQGTREALRAASTAPGGCVREDTTSEFGPGLVLQPKKYLVAGRRRSPVG